MAPLPKRRHSTRRGGKRKASISLDLATLGACSHCGAQKLPHRVCIQCGYYDDKVVIVKKTDNKKKQK